MEANIQISLFLEKFIFIILTSLYYYNFIIFISYSGAGRGNLVWIHSVLYSPLTFRDIKWLFMYCLYCTHIRYCNYNDQLNMFITGSPSALEVEWQSLFNGVVKRVSFYRLLCYIPTNTKLEKGFDQFQRVLS